MLSFLFFRMKGGIIMGRKVKITMPEISQKEIEISGKSVKINSLISLENYETIAEDIRNTILYNGEVIDKYALIKMRYIKDVLELCTNIDTTDLEGEDFNKIYAIGFLAENILNFNDTLKSLEKEYDKWVVENCFGIIANKLPTASEMETSMAKLSETIENLPDDKLELIGKSIVWNNLPALGQQIAPASHISTASEE